MTTYNTGNAIGSTDPKDLYDNAENLDVAVNDGGTWKDRLGVTRPTIKKLEQLYPSANFFYETLLQSGILSNSLVYESISDGLSDTTDEDLFWVLPNSSDDLDHLTLFLNDNGNEDKLYTLYNLNAFMIEEGETWEI